MLVWCVEDEGTIESEVAEGEALLAETLFKGQHFEIGEPFEPIKFNVKAWARRTKPMTPKDYPSLNLPPLPKKPPEALANCSFCGGHHYPTSQETIQCMGVYWTLHGLKGNRPPSQEEVQHYLYQQKSA